MSFPNVTTRACLVPEVDTEPPAVVNPLCADPLYAAQHPDECGTTGVLVIRPNPPVLCVGETFSVKAYYVVNGVETQVTPTWSSTDPSVSTISSSGLVTAVAVGSSQIKAEYDGQQGTLNTLVSGSVLGGEATCCADVDVAMMVLVDNSHSMRQEFNADYATRLVYAKQVATDALTFATLASQVGLASFNDEDYLTLQALTATEADAVAAVPYITQSDRLTEYYNAVKQSLATLNAATADARVLVIISDGEDKSPAYTANNNPLTLLDAFKDEEGNYVITVGVRAAAEGMALLKTMANDGYHLNVTGDNVASAVARIKGLLASLCVGTCTTTEVGVEEGCSYPTASYAYVDFKKWDSMTGGWGLHGPLQESNPMSEDFQYLHTAPYRAGWQYDPDDYDLGDPIKAFQHCSSSIAGPNVILGDLATPVSRLRIRNGLAATSLVSKWIKATVRLRNSDTGTFDGTAKLRAYFKSSTPSIPATNCYNQAAPGYVVQPASERTYYWTWLKRDGTQSAPITDSWTLAANESPAWSRNSTSVPTNAIALLQYRKDAGNYQPIILGHGECFYEGYVTGDGLPSTALAASGADTYSESVWCEINCPLAVFPSGGRDLFSVLQYRRIPAEDQTAALTTIHEETFTMDAGTDWQSKTIWFQMPASIPAGQVSKLYVELTIGRAQHVFVSEGDSLNIFPYLRSIEVAHATSEGGETTQLLYDDFATENLLTEGETVPSGDCVSPPLPTPAADSNPPQDIEANYTPPVIHRATKRLCHDCGTSPAIKLLRAVGGGGGFIWCEGASLWQGAALRPSGKTVTHLVVGLSQFPDREQYPDPQILVYYTDGSAASPIPYPCDGADLVWTQIMSGLEDSPKGTGAVSWKNNSATGSKGLQLWFKLPTIRRLDYGYKVAISWASGGPTSPGDLGGSLSLAYEVPAAEQECFTGYGESTLSMADAESKALADAQSQLDAANLTCPTAYSATQTREVSCDPGTYDDAQPVSASATATSLNSVEAAESFAYSKATTAAQDLLDCTDSTNDESITVPTQGQATPYPSLKYVTGSGIASISSVVVSIEGITHGSFSDLAVALQSPAGTTVMLWTKSGTAAAVSELALTIDDGEAPTYIPAPGAANPTSGAYAPQDSSGHASHAVKVFGLTGSPTPPQSWTDTLASFAGEAADGYWKLWIVDTLALQGGTIARWDLTIT